MRLLSGYIILCLVSFLCAQEDSIISVDISAGMVGGIDMTLNPESIAREVGPDRFHEDVEILEGTPNTVYVIDFQGHKVYRHWNGVSFTDSVFVTDKGLHVGAKVSEFDAAYGYGEIMWGEGWVIHYQTEGVHFYIMVGHENFSEEGRCVSLKSRECKSNEIWINIPVAKN